MTCIVGLVEGGQVWIGGDGRACFSDSVMPVRAPKVFRCGPLLIGVSGMPRVAQIWEHEFQLPPRGDDDVLAWLCRDVAPPLRDLMTVRGATYDSSADGTKTLQSHALIACEGRLFLMDGQCAFYETERAFECCGSGADVASGYLLGNKLDEPEKRVKGALRAAGEMLNSCGPPYRVEKL